MVCSKVTPRFPQWLLQDLFNGNSNIYCVATPKFAQWFVSCLSVHSMNSIVKEKRHQTIVLQVSTNYSMTFNYLASIVFRESPLWTTVNTIKIMSVYKITMPPFLLPYILALGSGFDLLFLYV